MNLFRKAHVWVWVLGLSACSSVNEEKKMESNVTDPAGESLLSLCEDKGFVHESNISDMTSSGVYALSRGLSASPESSERTSGPVTLDDCKRSGFVDKAELEAELGETYVVTRTTTDDGRPGLTIYAKRVGL